MPRMFDKLAMVRRLEADGVFTHAQAVVLAECLHDVAVRSGFGDAASNQSPAPSPAPVTPPEIQALPLPPKRRFGYVQYGILAVLAVAFVVLCEMFSI